MSLNSLLKNRLSQSTPRLNGSAQAEFRGINKERGEKITLGTELSASGGFHPS